MAVTPAVPHQQWLAVIQGLKDVINPPLNGHEVLCRPPWYFNVGDCGVHIGPIDVSQFCTSPKHIAWEQVLHPGIQSWLCSLVSGCAVELAVAEKEVDLHSVDMLGAKEAVCGCAGLQDGAYKICALTLHFL